VLRTWFGDCDIQQLLRIEADTVDQRHHIVYRFLGERHDRPFIIEQQAYYEENNGRIAWIRILCSGFQTP
jgi:hypothetical protein